jgi:serine/threonine protein kinase/tetratricopeptide (TPR) repeat protein
MGTFQGTSRFRVVRQLGAGGMGVVYEALDVERNEHVALKTLEDMDAEALLRFKREFRALHGLDHPNLVRLGELFEQDGRWFFTMELVPGEDFLSHVWTTNWRAVHEEAASAATVRKINGPASAPVTPTGVYDEVKLRAAIRQLAAGLTAIHDVGHVHRDIKPSNVSITPEGRLVILDFGLITGLTHSDRSTVAGLAGTPAYMAPEQVAGEHVGPAADWFSAGVMLFQALTGRLPLDGKLMHILKQKGTFRPPAPRAVNPEVPDDLDTLCVRLLELDPGARVSGAHVLEHLGATPRSVPPGGRPSDATFVGRAKQLSQLEEAWASLAEGRPSMVLVDGASGMGKSALLTAFVRRITQDDPSVVVLRGRAYEHENIPYNLFDRVVDSLSRLLRSLPPERASELLPLNAFLLPRVFPVLGRVDIVVRLARRMNMQLDTHELRSRVFAALREMLARVAERRPLLVILDDVQWAGRDSLMLLGELIRPPDPPPMMLILSSREGRLPDPYAGATGSTVQWWVLPDDLRRVSLGPLASEDAVALATLLVERAGLTGLDPAAVAEEAEGHPLFIQELVRHAEHSSGPDSERPRLDETILARVNGLDDDARQLLALTAIAGGPVGIDVLARAMDASPVSLVRQVNALERDHFLRSDLSGDGGSVEPYHDRVRLALATDLPAERRKDLHRRLAAALEGSAHPDPIQLTRHLAGAGDLARASVAAFKAAEQAEEGLAFDRAADLFQLCLDLSAEGHEVRERLARALARAGRCVEASAAYLDAAVGRDATTALELRGVAAQQAMQGGQLDRGVELARDVLLAIDVRPPKTVLAVVVGMLWLRLLLKLRGMTPRKTTAESPSRVTLGHVDLLHDLAATTLGADTFLGQWMSTRALLMALECGEPMRASRSLAMDAATVASIDGGWSAAAKRRMAIVHELELPLDRPSGWTLAMTGVIDCAAARYATAVNRIDEAVEIFREKPGAHFEVFASQIFTASALYALGRIATLRELSGRMLRAATDSGDAYHAAFYRTGVANVATWLSTDQPDRALEEIGEAGKRWARERFDMIAFAAFHARVENALYRGDGAGAWGTVAAVWPRLARSGLLASTLVSVLAFDLRGRAALAHAIASPAGSRAMTALVARAARRLAADDAPAGAPRAAVLRAGLASLRGDAQTTARHLTRAAIEFEALEMNGHSAAVRYQLRRVTGSDDARPSGPPADGWFVEQGVKAPARWSRRSSRAPPRSASVSGGAPRRRPPRHSRRRRALRARRGGRSAAEG